MPRSARHHRAVTEQISFWGALGWKPFGIQRVERLPNQICRSYRGEEFGVAIHEGNIAGRPWTMPAFRIGWKDEDIVAEQGGSGWQTHASGALSRQASIGKRRQARSVEHVGISHPLDELVTHGVTAPLIKRTSHHR